MRPIIQLALAMLVSGMPLSVAAQGDAARSAASPAATQPATQPATHPATQPAIQPAIQPAAQPAIQPAAQPPTQVRTTTAAALSVTELELFEPDSLAKIVAAQAGQPFWLVLWDMECPYCIQFLHQLAARQKRDAQLRVVTISTDHLAQADVARQRLQGIGISGGAWVFGEASTQELRFAIDPAWRGEKPRAYYYDGSGQRKTISGLIDLDKFKP